MARLTPAQIRRFERDGVVFPIRAFEPSEMAECMRRLEAAESDRAGRLPPLLNLKPHLLLPWLWDVVHDPRVVGPVRDLLGPDVLCWASSFFSKGPGEPGHVPWHQDATYWGLSEPRALTAWIAFTDSTRENGCLRVAAGSHHAPLQHHDTFDPANMLAGRERIEGEVDQTRAVDVVLGPGDMSLHHVLVVHGSEPNLGGRRRVGFAVRYIDGRLRQGGDVRGSATLVSGEDHGGFDLEPRPERDFAADAVARHPDVLRRFAAVVRPGPKGSS